MPMVLPIDPRIPPKIAKLANLPVWKRKKVLVSLILSSDILAESDKTSPPTMARHEETEAISPTMKLVTGVVVPPMPIFKRSDFCKMKKTIKKANPITKIYLKLKRKFI